MDTTHVYSPGRRGLSLFGSRNHSSHDRADIGRTDTDAGNATGREISITDVDIAFETEGETGVVRLTATWEGLAGTDGDQLTVTEPFASGFEPDRTFVVTVPAGYAVDEVSPAPDERSNGHLTWAPGSDLSGFDLSASPVEDETATDDGGEVDGSDTSADGDSDTGGDESAGESGPGFGPVLAVVAVLGAALLAAGRD